MTGKRDGVEIQPTRFQGDEQAVWSRDENLVKSGEMRKSGEIKGNQMKSRALV